MATYKAKYEQGVCRFCGCIDNKACPGGCVWMDKAHTLCSVCFDKIIEFLKGLKIVG
jgi:hypothetical protein